MSNFKLTKLNLCRGFLILSTLIISQPAHARIFRKFPSLTSLRPNDGLPQDYTGTSYKKNLENLSLYASQNIRKHPAYKKMIEKNKKLDKKKKEDTKPLIADLLLKKMQKKLLYKLSWKTLFWFIVTLIYCFFATAFLLITGAGARRNHVHIVLLQGLSAMILSKEEKAISDFVASSPEGPLSDEEINELGGEILALHGRPTGTAPGGVGMLTKMIFKIIGGNRNDNIDHKFNEMILYMRKYIINNKLTAIKSPKTHNILKPLGWEAKDWNAVQSFSPERILPSFMSSKECESYYPIGNFIEKSFKNQQEYDGFKKYWSKKNNKLNSNMAGKVEAFKELIRKSHRLEYGKTKRVVGDRLRRKNNKRGINRARLQYIYRRGGLKYAFGIGAPTLACLFVALAGFVVYKLVSWAWGLISNIYHSFMLSFRWHYYSGPVEDILTEAVTCKLHINNLELEAFIDANVITPLVKRPHDIVQQRRSTKLLEDLSKVPHEVQPVTYDPVRLDKYTTLTDKKHAIIDNIYFRITLITDILEGQGMEGLKLVPILYVTQALWGKAGSGKTYSLKNILADITELPVRVVSMKGILENPEGESGFNGKYAALTSVWFSGSKALPLNFIPILDDCERGFSTEHAEWLLRFFDSTMHEYSDKYMRISLPVPIIKIATGNTTGIAGNDNYQQMDAVDSKRAQSALIDRMLFQPWDIETAEEAIALMSSTLIPIYESVFQKLDYGAISDEEYGAILEKVKDTIYDAFDPSVKDRTNVSYRAFTKVYVEARLDSLKKRYLEVASEKAARIARKARATRDPRTQKIEASQIVHPSVPLIPAAA